MPNEQKLLSDKALEEIRSDIANTKPSSSPQGLFRQHCEDLLVENATLRGQLGQTRQELLEAATNEANIWKTFLRSSGVAPEGDDSADDWAVLLSSIVAQRNLFRDQFELLDDPQGLYSEARERIVSAVRDKCVEKVKLMRDDWQKRVDESEDESAVETVMYSRVYGADKIIAALESLTPDQLEQGDK